MNRTLALVRYACVDGKGWRRGPAVITRNGKLTPNTMKHGGVEVFCPSGRFQMRRYEGKRPIYTELGNDPTDALNRYRAEESKLRAHTAAIAAGLEVVTPAVSRRKTLRERATAFLSMHEDSNHRSDDALRVYTQVTGTFLNATKAMYPEQVCEEEIIRWHAWMRRERNYSDRTCSNFYKALRAFLKYCKLDLDDLISKGTHKTLRTYTRKKVNTYTPEQVEALVSASPDENRALLWDFAYKTGLRDSELQMITRFDLHGLEADDPTVHVKERVGYGTIKDAEEREIELHPSLVSKLKRWLKSNPEKTLLFGTVNDRPDTKMLLALKITARRAGLNCGRCKGCQSDRNECSEYTLHRFRRTFVTRMLRATGGDLSSVMARSGHSDLASVMRYLAPEKHIRQAVTNAF